MKRRTCAVLVALCTTGATVGCGGDEEPLSKAEYIKQGDAICKKAGDKLDKEAEKTFAKLGPNQAPTEKQLTPFVEDTVKPEIESQISDLRELSPPKGDEDKVNKIYDQAEDAIAKVESDPGVLLQQGNDPFEDANQAAQDYGFKECGEG